MMLQSRPRAFFATSRRPALYVAKTAGCRAAVLEWPEITIEAGRDVLEDFYLSPGSKPSTSPTPLVSGSTAQTTTNKPVLLYRDTNGWCPYCQLVWMALLEKNIPFDTMLIDLRNKPDWYTQVATNNKTPAVKFGNEVMCESLDIMFALEERFPQAVSLLPKDAAKREAATDFVRNWGKDYGSKLLRPTLLRFTSPGPAADAAVAEAAGELWQLFDGLLEQHGGPFLFGDYSLADICAINSAMRIRQADPTWQSAAAQFPRVASWFDAVTSRDSWKKTCIDDGTYSLLLKKLDFAQVAGVEPSDEVDMSHIDEESMRARREAAAKIASNREIIAEKIVMESGVLRGPGSTLGPGYSNINGYMMPIRKGALLEEADDALQRLCTMLLTDRSGDVPPREAAAVQVAMLAYFANLASAPRDLTAAAVIQLRAACHKVIMGLYLP